MYLPAFLPIPPSMPVCLQACLNYRSSTFPVHLFAYLYASLLHVLTICLSARLSSCLFVFLLAGIPAFLSYLYVLVCIFATFSASYSACLFISLLDADINVCLFACLLPICLAICKHRSTSLLSLCRLRVCKLCVFLSKIVCACTLHMYNCNVHVRRMGCM